MTMSGVAVSDDSLRQALKKVGLERIDKDILNKCTSLCTNLHLSPSQVAECWEVYSLNKNVTQLTEHTFQSYRLELIKSSEKYTDVPETTTSSSSSSAAAVVQRSGLGKRSIPLVTPPSKRFNSASNNGSSSSDHSSVSAVDAIATSSSQVTSSSPTAATKAAKIAPKYNERTGSGKVVVTYNPQKLPAPTTDSTSIKNKKKCTVAYDSFETNVETSYRHMFTTLEEKAQALDHYLTGMGEEIITRYGIGTEQHKEEGATPDAAVSSAAAIAPLEAVGVPRQDKVCCIGRICNSAHEGRINPTSVVLEGSRHVSGGARVDVDLSFMQKSKSSSYSLFPGQIVAVEGMNPTGRKMVAHRICEGAAHPPLTSTVENLMRYHHSDECQQGQPLKLMSVCGPFTTSDNLDYEPLTDFLHQVSTEKPDVVIMVGPFVDLRHKMVQNGDTVLPFSDGDESLVSMEAFFANKVAALLEDLYDQASGSSDNLQTQFVLVPSLDDATAEWVYPQAPMKDSQPGNGKQLNILGADSIDTGTLGLHHVETIGRSNNTKNKRIHCVSNPCTLQINELVIGVSGTDALLHMSSDETSANLEVGSRLARISQHMLQQRSYYPLFPAAPGANLDWKQVSKWRMPCRPDILIVPSKLMPFCKPVLKNTLVVNPGYLSRDTTGGTYATMQVHPIPRETLENAAGSGEQEVALEHGVADRMHLEIKRI